MPNSVNLDETTSRLKDGVLEISVPWKDTTKSFPAVGRKAECSKCGKANCKCGDNCQCDYGTCGCA